MTSSETKTDLNVSEPATGINSLTLEVLKVIKEAQQQHGLRHSDYQRYRAYCSRRLRRIRKTLHFVCGNQRRFEKKEINIEKINDSKYLLIPLFQAERAWSYAMQLKQESNSEPRKKFHLVNRLRKAIKSTSELEKLSLDAKFDAQTKLETQGYNAWMNGQFYFEVEKWEESLKYFNISKNIYEKLSSALSGDELQTLYKQRAEEVIPNIRYCAYNIGDKTALKDLVDMKLKSTGSELAENIDHLISQTKEKQIKTLSEVTWRGKVIQVKNEKVRLFLLNVQEYEKQIQSSSAFEAKSSIYDNILKESVDVIQILRDDLKTDSGFKLIQRGQKLEEKPSNLLFLFSYLSFIRLSKIIERNLLMLVQYKENLNKQSDDGKKLAKPQDIVRIYDIIIQNYNDISNLPGLTDDALLLADNELYVTYFNAYRSYYISLFYTLNKKYKEGAGFYFRVEKNIKNVEAKLKEITSKSQISPQEIQNGLNELRNELSKSKFKLQTSAFLEENLVLTDTESEKINEKLNKIQLIERLDTYYEDSNLINKNSNIIKLPVDFEPIPCKPLFFDLALNHIELPSLEDKIDSKRNQAQQPSGVKGFFKGLLGFN